jgi:hypothetical protein
MTYKQLKIWHRLAATTDAQIQEKKKTRSHAHTHTHTRTHAYYQTDDLIRVPAQKPKAMALTNTAAPMAAR